MKNRWLIALSAIGIHICIGSVYAWSVLTKPIMQAMGFTLKETTWTFSIAILFLGLSAGFLGDYVEKYGPRKSGLTSTCFFGLGMFGTALALHLNSLPLLYLFYGCYRRYRSWDRLYHPCFDAGQMVSQQPRLCHRSCYHGFRFCQPDRRSADADPGCQIRTGTELYHSRLRVHGYHGLPPALYLEPPKASNGGPSGINVKSILPDTQFTAKEARKTWQFYALWWIFFTNITCGIGLLAVASPMAQEVVKMTPMAAASMVGIIGLINGLGRIFWSTISDYLGRSTVYVVFFLIQIFAFYALAETSSAFIFQLIVFVIISCYGGGFSCMPAFLSDLFGTKELSAIHGKILTAWGMAGIAGPLLLSWIRETTNSYSITLYFFSACFVVSLIIAGILKWRTSVGVLIEKKHL